MVDSARRRIFNIDECKFSISLMCSENSTVFVFDRFNPRVEDIEPHIVLDHPDPQREEFERIAQANKDGQAPPVIPVFNPNLHPEVHKHAGQEEVMSWDDRIG